MLKQFIFTLLAMGLTLGTLAHADQPGEGDEGYGNEFQDNSRQSYEDGYDRGYRQGWRSREGERQTEFQPQNQYYCYRSNCAPPVLNYPARPFWPNPAPIPPTFQCGSCFMRQSSYGIWDLVLNNQRVLYRGYIQNTRDMALYYKAQGVCLNF